MQPLLAAGSPWRLVGEPTWLTEPGGEVWSRFEAVANQAFIDYPYYSLCLHDRRRLPAEVVDAQMRVHPLVWDGDAPVRCPHYEPTDVFLRDAEPAWNPDPDVRTVVVTTWSPAQRQWAPGWTCTGWRHVDRTCGWPCTSWSSTPFKPPEPPRSRSGTTTDRWSGRFATPGKG